MSHIHFWGWATLFLLGAWHGANPAMGWLFAVALGLQKQDASAVWLSLIPIATGHMLAIATVLAIAAVASATFPLQYAKVLVAILLLSFGVYRLIAGRHPRWGGMQVGFGDLTIWSFLMASAHGAGLMLLPVLLGMSLMSAGHEAHMLHFGGITTQLLAVAIHTFAYLFVTGVIAWVVYRKLGLSILRRAWLNLDRIWAVSLIVTAAFTLLISG
jgi:hypothetical protein